MFIIIYAIKWKHFFSRVNIEPQFHDNDILTESKSQSYLEKLNFLQWVSDVVFLLESVSVLEENFNSLVVIPFCRIDHGVMVCFRGSYKILMSLPN